MLYFLNPNISAERAMEIFDQRQKAKRKMVDEAMEQLKKLPPEQLSDGISAVSRVLGVIFAL